MSRSRRRISLNMPWRGRTVVGPEAQSPRPVVAGSVVARVADQHAHSWPAANETTLEKLEQWRHERIGSMISSRIGIRPLIILCRCCARTMSALTSSRFPASIAMGHGGTRQRARLLLERLLVGDHLSRTADVQPQGSVPESPSSHPAIGTSLLPARAIWPYRSGGALAESEAADPTGRFRVKL
jgi:hypothetical protein